MLSIKLAEQIVLQTKEKLHHNINVISMEGVILASKDEERIDAIHEGALQVIETGEAVYLDDNAAKQLQNSKAGVNLPIRFHDQMIGVIGITGDPEQLREIGDLVQLTTEMIVHQVLRENESEWQRKNSEFIFKALIAQAPLDASMQTRIEKLPFLLKGPYEIVLIRLLTEEKQHQFSLQLENILYRRAMLFGQTDMEEYYICMCEQDDTLLRQLQQLQQKFAMAIGVGPTVPTLNELPFAYNGAKKALAHSDERGIKHFQDIEIYTVLKDETSQEAHQYRQKIAMLSPKLLDTLRAFLACNLQLNACAEALDIHRHTLKYRLNQVYTQTGYDPTQFSDAFTLQIALLFARR